MLATMPPTDRMRPSWRVIGLLLLATVVVRVGVVTYRYRQLERDPDAYRQIAENLVEHDVYSRAPRSAPARPTAFRPPLYPLLLAVVSRNGHVTLESTTVLHVALGIATVLLTLFTAIRWGLGRGAWIAAMCVACDPILLNQSTQIMTETLAAFLAVGVLWTLTWRAPDKFWGNALLAGLVLGVAALCRPPFLVWAALIAAVLIWRGRGFGWRGPGRALALVAGVAIALAPWTARNWYAFGRPVPATTHGGYTLLLGNNRFFYEHLRTQPWGKVWDARELQTWLAQQATMPRANQVGRRTEIEEDRHLYGLAWQAIRRAPSAFGYACAVRLARLWSPLPHRLHESESESRRLVRYGIAIWYLLVYGLALSAAVRHIRTMSAPPWIWGLLLVLAFSIVHTIYWSNLRMRAPLMPFVYLVAAWRVRSRASQ